MKLIINPSEPTLRVAVEGRAYDEVYPFERRKASLAYETFINTAANADLFSCSIFNKLFILNAIFRYDEN
jgi:hypothetical protein